MKLLKSIFNLKSSYFFILFLSFVLLALYEYARVSQVSEVNQKLAQDELIINDSYEELTLFSHRPINSESRVSMIMPLKSSRGY